MLNHCRLWAGYHLKINRQAYQAASTLDETARNSDESACFGAAMGTLNPILVNDALVVWTAEELEAADLDPPLAYYNTNGEGSTLLSQRGIDIDSTDFWGHTPRLDDL